MPLAVTEKVTDSPVHFVALTGLLLIEGGVLIVNVAVVDGTGEPHVALTTTSYEPASPVPTGLIVKVAVVAPEILPPSVRFTPPFRHW